MADSNITSTKDDKDNNPGPSRHVRTKEPQSASTHYDESSDSEEKEIDKEKVNRVLNCATKNRSSSSCDSNKSDVVEYDTDFDEIDVNNSSDGDEESAAGSRTEARAVNSADTECMRQELESHNESITLIRNIKKSAEVKSHGRSAMPRIQHELREITKNPPPNCTAEMGDSIFHWTATILGPSGTVYEGGTFSLDISFPQTYPFRPPRIRFTTRIYHCNIDGRGLICLDILNEKWSPVLTISKVLLSIWLLLCECNPDDPLVMSIAEQYSKRRLEHDKMARLWVKKYAMQNVNEDDVKLEETEMTAVASQTDVNPALEPEQMATTSDGKANEKKEQK